MWPVLIARVVASWNSHPATYFIEIIMGESFQDYSWIQDFEADFPQKVSLKILNSAGNNSFSDLVQFI